MMRSRFVWIAIAALMAGGCARETPTTAALDGGDALYKTHCAICHGATGDGSGQVPSQVDFTSRHWQQYRSDADIRGAIRSGVGGTVMPAFPALSDEQVDVLVAHLRKFRE